MTMHESLFLLKFLETKLRIENEFSYSYDLYYTVIEKKEEKIYISKKSFKVF